MAAIIGRGRLHQLGAQCDRELLSWPRHHGPVGARSKPLVRPGVDGLYVVVVVGQVIAVERNGSLMFTGTPRRSVGVGVVFVVEALVGWVVAGKVEDAVRRQVDDAGRRRPTRHLIRAPSADVGGRESAHRSLSCGAI